MKRTKMKIKTLLWTVVEISERWKNQYKGNCSSWSMCISNNSEEIYNKLLQAKNLTECDKIIENMSWTSFQCSECNKLFKKGKALIFNKRVPWETDEIKINLCMKCYKKLKEMIDKRPAFRFKTSFTFRESKKLWNKNKRGKK
jgi:hypothetical protein